MPKRYCPHVHVASDSNVHYMWLMGVPDYEKGYADGLEFALGMPPLPPHVQQLVDRYRR